MVAPNIPQAAAVGNYADVNGMRMYYELSGNGPALILLHGGAGTCRMWDRYTPMLTQHFCTMMPDSRAHGRSDNPAGTLSYHTMADDIAELVRVLSLDRPLIVGYSDGGGIGLELAIRYPGVARAYVMGGVSYRSTGMGGTGDEGMAAIEQWLSSMVPGWREPHDLFHGPDYWKTLLKQLYALWNSPFEYGAAELGQIREPTLILLGDRDEVNPLDQSVEMYRMIPNAELAIMPGAKHTSILPYSEVFASLLLDFLSRHSS